MDKIRNALEMAHHELTTLGGLKAFDEADPQITITIDPSEALASLDDAIRSMDSPISEAALDSACQEGPLGAC